MAAQENQVGLDNKETAAAILHLAQLHRLAAAAVEEEQLFPQLALDCRVGLAAAAAMVVRAFYQEAQEHQDKAQTAVAGRRISLLTPMVAAVVVELRQDQVQLLAAVEMVVQEQHQL
jgi:hypothetical protein